MNFLGSTDFLSVEPIEISCRRRCDENRFIFEEVQTPMQPERIILIPPTHEQTTPSYHLEAALLEPFLAFLGSNGITAWQPPEDIGNLGPQECALVEIEIEAGTSMELLEKLQDEFLESQGLSNLPSAN